MQRASERLALDGQRVGIGVQPPDDLALRQTAVRIGAVFQDLINEQRRKLPAAVPLAGGCAGLFVFQVHGDHILIHPITPPFL